MDIKIRNKVADIQKVLEQEEQHISFSDPIAKMMLVAMAHQTCELEDKMDRSLDRISEMFTNKVLQRTEFQAKPAIGVVNIGNGSETEPYVLNEGDIFTCRSSQCNYRPIFDTRIIPGTISACFMKNFLFQPGVEKVSATWPDEVHKDEIWIAYDAYGEVENLENVVIAFSHPLPSRHLVVECGDVSMSLKPLMDGTSKILNSNFMLSEFWKKSLVFKGLWLYRFGSASSSLPFKRREIPSWIMDSFTQESLDAFVGNRYIWLRIKSEKPIDLGLSPAILFNCVPIVNYNIENVKLSYTEPIQRLENYNQNSYFLDMQLDPETDKDFFIRDFDVAQYNDMSLKDDILNLYRHYVEDYYAFVDNNSLHDGAALRSLRQSMSQIFDSLEDDTRHDSQPYSGVYAIRSPRNSQQPIVITYYTTNGEKGNLLNRSSRLSCSNASVGTVEVLVDALGGRDKMFGRQACRLLSQSLVCSNDRLYSLLDLERYCQTEFMRSFGEEAMRYCNISIDEDYRSEGDIIEKSLCARFDISSDNLKELVSSSDFYTYLMINVDLRKSFSWKFHIDII